MSARHAAPNFIHTNDGTMLFYRDWGQGAPVVFVGSWSLPSDMWNYQTLALSEQGLRCISYDRRGHGRSSDPGRGYDFDTLADDLAALLEVLDLRGVTLVGHSMGCGEIVRYLTRFGSDRVARIALLGTTTPMLALAPDNPDGIDVALFEFFQTQQLMRDYPEWIEENLPPFVVPQTTPAMVNWVRQMALNTSAKALKDCNTAVVRADFRQEMKRINVPTLILHGDLDASAPLALTAEASAALVPGAVLKIYQGAPHGFFITHMDGINADLLAFAGADQRVAVE
ncbi:alpha/beta hydrolase [Pseudolysobacter antarcticus]|uniref:Alpha/beta hydrolase n=2 Tax=Pseudolysobacter antarcticus TaxID=2511995 RepID=A0A411HQE1_9GAMM|nr:alpha/beta hydrolase [Pseudolysobacter antarcticus]